MCKLFQDINVCLLHGCLNKLHGGHVPVASSYKLAVRKLTDIVVCGLNSMSGVANSLTGYGMHKRVLLCGSFPTNIRCVYVV